MTWPEKAAAQKVSGSGAPSANESLMTETGEETVPAVEKTVAPSEDAVRAATENSVIAAAEEIQAEPGFHPCPAVSMRRGDGATVDPVTGIVEAALTDDFEVLEELGDESLRAAQSIASSYSGNFRMFAAEAANYSKTCARNESRIRGSIAQRQILGKGHPVSEQLRQVRLCQVYGASFENERTLLESSRRGFQAGHAGRSQKRPAREA